ncbi:glycosyltransferase 8 domain-containing protein 2 isoform X1 [Sylvia atricapilla]|uniref:glycosyltransferase 8 domain-containing protein 2 isoform X1 n=3 Tax=Sylvia atricapilla TaxID=48155 RepID=UPI0033935F5C
MFCLLRRGCSQAWKHSFSEGCHLFFSITKNVHKHKPHYTHWKNAAFTTGHSSHPTGHMALLKKINQILLLLLVLTVCAILYNKVHQVPLALRNETVDLESPEETEEEIPVVICAAAGRMGAAVAAISSIYSNTEARVLFYIVGLKTTIPHIRKWIENSKLKEIKFKVVEFNPMVLKGKIRQDASRPELLQPLNFIRFYLPLLIQKHEKVIYLDDDVIVQGDIQELYDTKLAPGHAAAFSDDCDLPSTHEMIRSVGMQNTYMGFLDYRKQGIRDLGISPSTCSFNPGVIVANMTEWKHQRITKQLEKWMQRNVEENLYSSTLGGGVATSPMLIVFYGKHSSINPMWHIRHLGWSPDARYSEQFLQEAKLLHWNGRYKPWDYPSVHTDLWENWFIPDPSGKFKLTRPDS